ncbi:O-antigen ligase family protein [Rhodococcus koreensis]
MTGGPDQKVLAQDLVRAPHGRTERVTFLLVFAVVAGSFLGRYSFDLAGFTVRWEQVAPVVFVGWLLVQPGSRLDLLRTLRHPVVLMFLAFIVWNAVATVLFSPSLNKSVAILGWLGIDLLLLAGLMSLGARVVWAENIGIRFVVPWALAGFAMYLVANRTAGDLSWGTNLDSLYDVYVTRLSATEANIYASILVFWTLLLVARKGSDQRWMIAVAVTVPLGLIASQTRTAVFCMVMGLAVYVGYELVRRRRNPAPLRALIFGPAAVVVGVLVAYGATTALPDVGVQQSAQEGRHETAPEVRGDTARTAQDKLGDIDFTGGTVGFRMAVAREAAEDLRGVHLWLGNGTNTFGLRHEQPGSPGVSGHIIMLPVQILYDAGIVGLVLLGAFGVVVWRHVPWRRRPIAAAVAATFVAAATLTSMFWFSVVWIVVASLLRPLSRDECETGSGARLNEVEEHQSALETTGIEERA